MTEADPGLSFAFNAEQELFRQRFANSRQMSCRRTTVASRGTRRIPVDLWKKFVDVGLTGVGIAEEYGGQGGGIIEQVILDEELSRTLAGLYWLLESRCSTVRRSGPSEP